MEIGVVCGVSYSERRLAGRIFFAIAFFDVGNEFFVRSALLEVGDEGRSLTLDF